MEKRNHSQKRNPHDEQRQFYLKIAFFSVFACVALIFLLLAFDKIPQSGNGKKAKEIKTEAQTDENSTESEIQKETLAAETTVTISLVGDCTLGTDEYFDTSTNFNAYYSLYGQDYFFQNVKSILSADDLTIANFEGTLTSSTMRENKTYAFKGAPEYASILTSGSIEAVNLANNHSHDYGMSSYSDTQNNLQAAGITTFGYDETSILDINGIKVGLVGIYELDTHLAVQTQLVDNINKVVQEGADYVIVNFHWGSELATVPDSNQTTLAHAAVDAGADLVIGHHPHVLQGMENYNGKVIIYSLGNFCFGGNVYPSDFDTGIFQQTITFNTSKEPENITNKFISCSVSSESTYNNYQPMPASGDEKTRIDQKFTELSQQILSSTGASGTTGSSDIPSQTGTSEGSVSSTTSEDTIGSESDASSGSGNGSVQLFLPE